jgi:hypothetical protein
MANQDSAPPQGADDGVPANQDRLITFPTFAEAMETGSDRINIDTESLLEVFEDITPKQQGAFMLLAIEIRRRNDRSFLDDAGAVARILKCSKIAWLTRLKPVVMPLLDRVGEAV